jgi:hypothetical protein
MPKCAYPSALSIALFASVIGCSGSDATSTRDVPNAGGQAGSSAGGASGNAGSAGVAGSGVGGNGGSAGVAGTAGVAGGSAGASGSSGSGGVAGASGAPGAGGATGGAGGAAGAAGVSGAAGAAGVAGAGGTAITGPECSTDTTAGTAPNFGSNVVVFDPSMGVATIQGQINTIYTAQGTTQFSTNRKALLFKAGQYSGLNVDIGYYMQALGLGAAPDDVAITGEVRSIGTGGSGTNNVTLSFWRAAENMSVTPSGGTNRWAVSQGTQFRRMHVKGPLALSLGGWASGGFIADSKVDGAIGSGSQQQWFTRNTTMASWNGGVWNMTFVGCTGTPGGTWPGSPMTVVAAAPVIREKPYLFVNSAGRYCVRVPAVKTNVTGVSWASGPGDGPSMNMDQFYITAPTDTAATINAALTAGKNILVTPGIYHLESALQVARAGTVILGIGMTTLIPDKGTPAIVVADVDGVKIGGLMLDAGPQDSPTLLQVGNPGESKDHSADPTVLHDIVCRVGGGSAGLASSCLIVNSNNVIGDQMWLWRADHGSGAGWASNKSKNGIIVNGNNVTMYGLFAEHFQEYQVLWNGNGGKTYFYQSEMPYDPPDQASWMSGTVNGYASYKVANTVTTHEAWGLGIYCAFRNGVFAENAVETPTAPGVVMHHVVAQWLNYTGGITHVINGTGNAATSTSPHQTTAN